MSSSGDAAQDARELLGEVREMKFALEESDAAAEHLASELSAVQVRPDVFWPV